MNAQVKSQGRSKAGRKPLAGGGKTVEMTFDDNTLALQLFGLDLVGNLVLQRRRGRDRR